MTERGRGVRAVDEVGNRLGGAQVDGIGRIRLSRAVWELPPDEVEKIEGAKSGLSLVPTPGARPRAERDSGSRNCDPGRFLTSLRFRLFSASAVGSTGSRSANAEAVDANETWLEFHRDLSPPRIDSTGEVGLVEDTWRDSDRETWRDSGRETGSSGPVVSSSSVVVPAYSRQLAMLVGVGGTGTVGESRGRSEARCKLMRWWPRSVD